MANILRPFKMKAQLWSHLKICYQQAINQVIMYETTDNLSEGYLLLIK